MKAAIIVFADTDRPEGMGRGDHKYHGLLEEVREAVAGACVYCSRAYGVTDGVEAAGIRFLDEFRGHPSIRSLMASGHQVVTF
jgi:hypothetical protein